MVFVFRRLEHERPDISDQRDDSPVPVPGKDRLGHDAFVLFIEGLPKLDCCLGPLINIQLEIGQNPGGLPPLPIHKV